MEVRRFFDPAGAGRPSASSGGFVRWHSRLAAGLRTILLLLAGWIGLLLAVYIGARWVGRSFDSKARLSGIIAAGVESLHRRADLVVGQLHVTASVHLRQSTYWLGIYWGTTSADVTSYGNRVQYVVPLAGLTTGDFSYDAAANTLICSFPPPVVDTSLVQVQPDPSRLIVHGSNGWALFNKGDLERKAKAQLPAAILLQAKKQFLAPLVRTQARQTLKAFLRVVFHPLDPALHIRVRFEPARPSNTDKKEYP